PDTVKEIGDAAFFGCSSLTSIKIPASVTHISARAFYECEELCSIVMSEGIQSIGAEAFGRCVNLTKIVLPATVTELSYRVFIGCEGLTVYCKAADEGANWHPDWNVNNVPVEFGCTDSIIEMNPVGQE
ncbi:MAG: leucine-rich repeat domain-containing protein, partial [Clostridia bacterium]|nr:leucine-rich repeat domain-containing protein [Clostridia bacterium]